MYLWKLLGFPGVFQTTSKYLHIWTRIFGQLIKVPYYALVYFTLYQTWLFRPNLNFIWSRYIPSILIFVFFFKYIVNSVIWNSKDVALRSWKGDGNNTIVNHQLKKVKVQDNFVRGQKRCTRFRQKGKI